MSYPILPISIQLSFPTGRGDTSTFIDRHAPGSRVNRYHLILALISRLHSSGCSSPPCSSPSLCQTEWIRTRLLRGAPHAIFLKTPPVHMGTLASERDLRHHDQRGGSMCTHWASLSLHFNPTIGARKKTSNRPNSSVSNQFIHITVCLLIEAI